MSLINSLQGRPFTFLLYCVTRTSKKANINQIAENAVLSKLEQSFSTQDRIAQYKDCTRTIRHCKRTVTLVSQACHGKNRAVLLAELPCSVTRNTAYMTVTVSCHTYHWLAKACDLLVLLLQQ